MNQTWYIYIQFMLEYIIGTSLFLTNMPRRSRFPLHLARSLLGLSLFNTLVGAAVWLCLRFCGLESMPYRLLMIAKSIVSFLLMWLAVYDCFELSRHASCVCAIAGYAVQHLVNRINAFFTTGLENTEPLWFVFCRYFFILLVCCFLLWYFFARVKVTAAAAELNTHSILVIAGFLLAALVVVNSMVSPLLRTSLDFWARLGITLYAVISSMAVLLILYGQFEHREFERLRELEKAEFAAKKELMELVNIKYHDLSHRLKEYNGQIPAAEMREVQNLVEAYAYHIPTGSEVLDTILAEISMRCAGGGIRLSCMVDGEKLAFLSETDTYALFHNILDNAIEAVSMLPADERQIDLAVRVSRGQVIIHQENRFLGCLTFQNGLPVTTHRDTRFHGYGTRSIDRVVRRYGGTLSIRTDDQLYRLNIIFPDKGSETE